MKTKQPPCFLRPKEKIVRINRVRQLNPAYCGNIAHLIRLYLRICRNPYLHLPRVRAADADRDCGKSLGTGGSDGQYYRNKQG